MQMRDIQLRSAFTEQEARSRSLLANQSPTRCSESLMTQNITSVSAQLCTGDISLLFTDGLFEVEEPMGNTMISAGC
jgi:hypothetical protein